MAKEKIPPHKVVMTEAKRNIIRGLLSEYDIKTTKDIPFHTNIFLFLLSQDLTTIQI